MRQEKREVKMRQCDHWQRQPITRVQTMLNVPVEGGHRRQNGTRLSG